MAFKTDKGQSFFMMNQAFYHNGGLKIYPRINFATPRILAFVKTISTVTITVVSATFTSATALVIVFSEPVTALTSDFTNGTTSAPGTFAVSGIAGSGTRTITLTVAGTPAIVTGITGTVNIGAGVKGAGGNYINPIVARAIVSGF